MKRTALACGRYRLSVSPGGMPLVMGVLNVTPDSFSDGGRFYSLEAALTHAEAMIEAGVDIIDIGGESSRPGAAGITTEEELRRILPVIFALRDCGKPLSVDTCKPAVMLEALGAGADMINDISGFRDEHVLRAIKDSGCALCIMHMQRVPLTMQDAPTYVDVLQQVTDFLGERLAACRANGIAADRLCIDPGFGFGKSTAHNIILLQHIATMAAELDMPVLAGLSRKALIGHLTGKPVGDRLAGSVAAAVLAAHNGAAIVRVHDVAETVDALKVWHALASPENKTSEYLSRQAPHH
jgi:dihydropteroate synthase